DKSAYELYIKIMKDLKYRKRWTSVNYIIIDEISMIGSSLLKKLDYIARNIRKKDSAFGGIRLIISGDMSQLPPVNDDFCFMDELWDKCNFEIMYLNTPWRFVSNINKLSNGMNTNELA